MHKNSQSNKNKYSKFIFLSIIALFYGILYFFNPIKSKEAFLYASNVFKEVMPILLLIYVFMVFFNFIPEKKLKSQITKSSKMLKYIIMSLLGMLSHGPIYAWYPLMTQFKQKGVSLGSIGAFLYARGIKLTLLPLLIHYFGLNFTIILTIVMLFASLAQAVVIDFFIPETEISIKNNH